MKDRILLLLGALLVGCSGSIEAPTDWQQMLGDRSFSIMQGCPEGQICFPECQNNTTEDVFVEDHGEPGNKPGPGNHGSMGPDYYHFTIRTYVSQTQSGALVYDTENPVTGGNLQLHPPNAGHPSIPESLPPWVSFQP